MTFTSEQSTLLKQEKTVDQYFEAFNAGNFAAAAALFAETGQLRPPFEESITGAEAIHTYLSQEAEGMQAYPQELEVESEENDRRRIVARGQVKALVFKVNCAWIFDLNSDGRIDHLRVKLLASMQELLDLRS